MPELDFYVDAAQTVPYAAAPQLALKLRIVQRPPHAIIHTVALRCQVRLEPGQRRYSPAEQEQLFDLFGEPQRWGQTVRSLLWTNAAIIVPRFEQQAPIDLPLPCTYDFNLAIAKYFHALDNAHDGHVPLSLLFSGTIFYAGDDGHLQIEQISWEKEAQFRLPVEVWKQTMELYFPNTAPLLLQRDVFDHLQRFKRQRGLFSWEQAIESLLASAHEEIKT
jgi:hypothetical protein